MCLHANSSFALANWVSMETAGQAGAQASPSALLMASACSPLRMDYVNEGRLFCGSHRLKLSSLRCRMFLSQVSAQQRAALAREMVILEGRLIILRSTSLIQESTVVLPPPLLSFCCLCLVLSEFQELQRSNGLPRSTLTSRKNKSTFS